MLYLNIMDNTEILNEDVKDEKIDSEKKTDS
jgi:hypothetical protein